MAINLKAARDFVYQHGELWERALFAYLFQNGSLDHLHDCLRAYQNEDGGYGNAFEPDIRYPGSHPLALEFLLGVITTFGVSEGDLLDGVPEWVEANRAPDGSLRNPPDLLDYPHAPWWADGGQTAPDSIVGNLNTLELASDDLRRSTRLWAQNNLTVAQIEANNWLFMAYHPFDYFMSLVPEAEEPELEATMANIRALAQTAPPEQYYHLFRFIPDPNWNQSVELPQDRLDAMLDWLEKAQHDDGSWHDQHGLAHWYPYTTILVLHGLKSHGRDIGTL